MPRPGARNCAPTERGTPGKGLNDMPQTKFMLKCADCGGQNYVTSKNRTNVTERLSLSKYCAVCRKHTKHDEARLRR